MNISKDEARILAAVLEDGKYNICNDFPYKDQSKQVFTALSNLQVSLEKFGNDKRRNGRKSQNDFSDLLKRYSK